MSVTNIKETVILPFDYVFNVDLFIKNFEENHAKIPGQRIDIKETDCKAICIIAKKIFSSEMTLLEILAPTKICGDLHGQWYDLMRIFQFCGQPATSRYLFLGDYVDRGTCSLETVCLLFAYKIKYPNRVYLLRGNHESAVINKVYGFYGEIMERFNSDFVYQLFNKVFDYLPIAAIVDGTIFCCHGGLSPALLNDNVKDLRKELKSIKRPLEIPSEGMICDLLWSDPIDSEDENENGHAGGLLQNGWALNSRGCSFVFGAEIVKIFLAKFKLELIVRAHQVVPDGYEFFCQRGLVTLFSVANYCGTFDNAAAVLIIERKNTEKSFVLQGYFQVLTPEKNIPTKWAKIDKVKKSGKSELKVTDSNLPIKLIN